MSEEEVEEKLVSKYLPPHLKEGGASERWTRRVQGLMNRYWWIEGGRGGKGREIIGKDAALKPRH